MGEVEYAGRDLAHHIREGQFQRSLALIAGMSSVIAGLEVSYEHYRGSYSNPVMYTPVVLSGALFATGRSAAVSRRAARSVLAGGFRAYSGRLRGRIWVSHPGHQAKAGRLAPVRVQHHYGAADICAAAVWDERLSGSGGIVLTARGFHGSAAPARGKIGKEIPAANARAAPRITAVQELREGRFQKHLALATAGSAFFSGIEALYSHYKNNFKYKVQWTPIAIAGTLIVTAISALGSPRVAKKILPAVSALAIADGGVGFYYHARGVVRRPGGLKHAAYNIMYGPPIFAPLLFAACGFLGMLAGMFRREH